MVSVTLGWRIKSFTHCYSGRFKRGFGIASLLLALIVQAKNSTNCARWPAWLGSSVTPVAEPRLAEAR
jgi:hypothetical protein